MHNGTRQGEEVEAGHRVQHLVETRDLQPDVCMFYPEAADDRRREAAWIAAKEHSFVDRLQYR